MNFFSVLKFFLVILAGFVFILAAAFLAVNIIFGTHPSDKKMISTFAKHEASFEKLSKMCYEDQYDVILDDKEWKFATTIEHQSRLSSSRRAEYRAHFNKIGIVHDVQCYNKTVTFWAHSWGLSISGHRKFYVYRPNDLETTPVVDSLDGKLEYNESIGATWAYRNIEGEWYLAYWGF
ncbi:MAG: hypothetical protein DHS20C05_08880 [Hyphococcus sp.]|nr:MAG: hypothetical protein DHS20C05_08880 [Marinicaulis sp.]